MELEARIQGAVQVVTVIAERIDSAIAIRFKDDMRAITQNGPNRVILDLGHVHFVDSSGLGAIVAAMKHLGPGRKLDLAGLNPDVDKVFRLTRMDRVFAIHPDVQAATGQGSGQGSGQAGGQAVGQVAGEATDQTGDQAGDQAGDQTARRAVPR